MNPSNSGLAKRALAMEKRIEQMDKVDRPVTAKKPASKFDAGGYAAKEIVSFDCVCKRYGDKVLLRNTDLKILKNDRIAFVGANGCGKSTLLKMIMGEEGVDNGSIKISTNAKIGYMPQTITFNNANATVLDTLRAATNVPEEKARSILARFHFLAADVMKKVGTLSGGEKSRLTLCLMMQRKYNFLLLDEPTNHLDIASREWIEKALSDFEGTMLFVSHDRYFLNKFADKVWSMEGGNITQYECGFEEYLEAACKNKGSETASKKNSQKSTLKSSVQSTPLKSEASSIEKQIVEAECALGKVNDEIEADLLKNDFSRMNYLHIKKGRLTELLADLYKDWIDSN